MKTFRNFAHAAVLDRQGGLVKARKGTKRKNCMLQDITNTGRDEQVQWKKCKHCIQMDDAENIRPKEV